MHEISGLVNEAYSRETNGGTSTMKKLVCLLVGMATMASVSMAQTNVLSQNAVGYVKKTIQPGEFDLIVSPFEKIDGTTPTLSELLPDVPNNTNVLLWDDVNQTYNQIQKNFLGQWPSDPEIARGTGFFVQIPASAPAAVDIYLLGEVPGATTWATTDLSLAEGFTMIGVPYPVAMTVESSGLGDAIPNNNSILLWDSTGQTYLQVSKNFLGAWSPANTVIEPGSGFFVSLSTAGGATYTETAPYAWPDN